MMVIKERKMTLRFRHYNYPEDYERVSRFLIEHHQWGNRDGNWLEPIWEYMHFHPSLDKAALSRNGIWEDCGKLVGVVHYESKPGEAFFEFDPEYLYLREEMLLYAEQELFGVSEQDGHRFLNVYVNDFDPEFQELVRSAGYASDPINERAMSRFEVPNQFPVIELPAGYKITSLAQEPDWEKVHRVIWRGFDHGEDVPMSINDLEERRNMFVTPKANLDLKIAIKAPNREFAAFCGMFYEPESNFALVEPVTTVPTYRRMGLGKAAVLEGIRRCTQLGADLAYVGSDQAFYLAIGFKVIFRSECWVKELGPGLEKEE